MTHVIQKEQDSKEIAEDERIVNYARGPPVYDGSDSNFITKIKEDLGIQVDRMALKNFLKIFLTLVSILSTIIFAEATINEMEKFNTPD